MDQRKLFNVLVIGGALLGLGCDRDASAPPGGQDADEVVDAASATADDGGPDDEATGDDASVVADAGAVGVTPGAADATPGAADAGAALENCGFCPSDCCVDDGMGGSRERDGFECCWGTSC